MRVISGQFGGRVFNPPVLKHVRPTTDRTKEALFNYFQFKIDWEEADCLDLYSGTGSISFEMASRGAASVTSVDRDPKLIKFLESTLSNWGYEGVNSFTTDVMHWLKSNQSHFDFIFADPPYQMIDLPQLPHLILPHLANRGFFVLEHPSGMVFNSKELIETRAYGDSSLSIFQKEV